MSDKINARHILYQPWTVEQVIYAIRERVKQKLSLSSNAVKQEEGSLALAVYRIFGSWPKMLEAAEIPPSQFGYQPCPKWSREKIIKALREWYLAHPIPPPINSKDEGRRRRLHTVAGMYSLNKLAVEKMLGANLVWKRSQFGLWNREKVIKALQERVRNKQPLNTMMVLKENESLYRAARHYFGSYRKAIKAAGFDYKHSPIKPWHYSKNPD